MACTVQDVIILWSTTKPFIPQVVGRLIEGKRSRDKLEPQVEVSFPVCSRFHSLPLLLLLPATTVADDCRFDCVLYLIRQMVGLNS